MAAAVEAQNHDVAPAGSGQGLLGSKEEDGTDLNLLKRETASGASYSTAISGVTTEFRPTPASGSSAENSFASRMACASRDIFPVFDDNDDTDPRFTRLDSLANHVPNLETISLSTEVVQGRFAFVSHMAECCRGIGVVELYRQPEEHQYDSTAGELVVVKRVPETWVLINRDNKDVCERELHYGRGQREAEDTLNEIGVYCLLFKESGRVPVYLLKVHDIFQAGPDVWLVLEHGDDGDLFRAIKSSSTAGGSGGGGGGGGPGLSTDQIMTWSWQLLQAVAYLHFKGIGHRDISAENILLRERVVRLMDFGQAVLTTVPKTQEFFRYYHTVGKPYYAGPECYVPHHSSVEIVVPPGSRGGDIVFAQTPDKDFCEFRLPADAAEGQSCFAEPWGYAVTFADVFACGVCLFLLATGMPPWKRANLRDPHFAWAADRGAVKLANIQLERASRPKLPDDLAELIKGMLACDPTTRPDAKKCLSYPFYDPLAQVPVAYHADSRSSGFRGLVRSADSSADEGIGDGDSDLGAAYKDDDARLDDLSLEHPVHNTFIHMATTPPKGRSNKSDSQPQTKADTRATASRRAAPSGDPAAPTTDTFLRAKTMPWTSSGFALGAPLRAKTMPDTSSSTALDARLGKHVADAAASRSAGKQSLEKAESSHSASLQRITYVGGRPAAAGAPLMAVSSSSAGAAGSKMPEARKAESSSPVQPRQPMRKFRQASDDEAVGSSPPAVANKMPLARKAVPSDTKQKKKKPQRKYRIASSDEDVASPAAAPSETMQKKKPQRKYSIAGSDEDDALSKPSAPSRKPSELVDKLSLSLLPPPPPLWRHGVTGKDY